MHRVAKDYCRKKALYCTGPNTFTTSKNTPAGDYNPTFWIYNSFLNKNPVFPPKTPSRTCPLYALRYPLYANKKAVSHSLTVDKTPTNPNPPAMTSNRIKSRIENPAVLPELLPRIQRKYLRKRKIYKFFKKILTICRYRNRI